MKDISIVIITWKMKSLLEVTLKTIEELTVGVNYELILIDNNSQDGTSEMIKKKYPRAILITNSQNLGVAPARNQGLKIAKGKYILILDADMELIENSIKKLYDFMESNPDCGLVGSKLVDTNRQLQYSCKRFPTILSLILRRFEHFQFAKNSKTYMHHIMLDWDHSEVKEVDYLIGACQLIRKEVVEKIGFYDDKIFYGPEDIDYCIRVWRAGWKVMYYPFTSIIHLEQRITKKSLLSKITIKHLLGIYYIFKKYNGKLKRF
jgi:hypothetical protein